METSEMRGFFEGKTLYRNGRRLAVIEDVVEVPRHYYCIVGRKTGREGGDFHLLLPYVVLEYLQMAGNGKLFWNGILYEVKDETNNNETKEEETK